MPDRIAKVNQLIKKELGRIILKEIDFSERILVTLTRVKTMPNLQQAKAYISVMPEDQITQILKILTRQVYFLQQILNKRLKMRPIPRIMFVEEKATKEAGRIEELLEKIKKTV